MIRRLSIVLSLGLVLAGCASNSVPWVNPSVPKDQWSRDYSACRRLGDRDIGWRDDDRDAGSPFRDYERQQAKRQYDAVVANCMIDRGYVPATRSRD